MIDDIDKSIDARRRLLQGPLPLFENQAFSVWLDECQTWAEAILAPYQEDPKWRDCTHWPQDALMAAGVITAVKEIRQIWDNPKKRFSRRELREIVWQSNRITECLYMGAIETGLRFYRRTGQGGVKAAVENKQIGSRNRVRMLSAQGMTPTEIHRKLGISRTTVYKHLKEKKV